MELSPVGAAVASKRACGRTPPRWAFICRFLGRGNAELRLLVEISDESHIRTSNPGSVHDSGNTGHAKRGAVRRPVQTLGESCPASSPSVPGSRHQVMRVGFLARPYVSAPWLLLVRDTAPVIVARAGLPSMCCRPDRYAPPEDAGTAIGTARNRVLAARSSAQPGPRPGAVRAAAGPCCLGRGASPIWYSAWRWPKPGCAPPSWPSRTRSWRSRTCERLPSRADRRGRRDRYPRGLTSGAEELGVRMNRRPELHRRAVSLVRHIVASITGPRDLHAVAGYDPSVGCLVDLMLWRSHHRELRLLSPAVQPIAPPHGLPRFLGERWLLLG